MHVPCMKSGTLTMQAYMHIIGLVCCVCAGRKTRLQGRCHSGYDYKHTESVTMVR